jgi:NADPH:quinone reductase-like Zn-dependent oxidoreductase
VNTPDLEYPQPGARREVRTVIDRRYPLEESGAALEYIGSQRARGKVIVTFE